MLILAWVAILLGGWLGCVACVATATVPAPTALAAVQAAGGLGAVGRCRGAWHGWGRSNTWWRDDPQRGNSWGVCGRWCGSGEYALGWRRLYVDLGWWCHGRRRRGGCLHVVSLLLARHLPLHCCDVLSQRGNGIVERVRVGVICHLHLLDAIGDHGDDAVVVNLLQVGGALVGMSCASHTTGDPEFVGLDEVAFELRPSFVVVGESVLLKDGGGKEARHLDCGERLVNHLSEGVRDFFWLGKDEAVFKTVN